MGLRLVLGRAGSGKSKLCQEEIVRELKERPDGFPLIYIVPEQATFQEEYALATAPGLGGMIRAQVLSFRRLAWKVMQEVGGGKRLFIDDTGKGMVLRRVLEKQRSRLRIFRHAGEQAGVLENLVQLYNELKRSCIPLSQLREVFQKRVEAGADLPSLFQEKMSDLLLILEEAEKELAGLYIDAEDYLNLLVELLPRSAYITEAEVWVDGFYGFTNQEYAVLEGLLGHCRRVTVTACLDRFRSPGEVLDELDPFYPAALTCRRLQQLADRCRIPVEKVTLEKGPLTRFAGSPELAYLEQKLHSYPVIPYKGEISCLTLAAAPNRRCEVESLAREMIRRCRDEGYRWRDMAVIVSELDDYCDVITTVFGDYHIPFFLDQKRPVIHHPLVEFIRSSMEVANRNWRYDAVFRCIKTEFLLPAGGDAHLRRRWRERADRLENYVLACGIQGRPWLQDEPWGYLIRDTLEEEGDEVDKPSAGEQAFLQQINETRQKVSAPLLHFQEKFKQAATVREKTAALYGLLQEAGVWERLELWSEEALEKEDAQKAREHQQVYKGIVGLLDQLVEIMGEEKI
ncbi:MAG: helicase-exonuclease AddAB subunit AddB, partial [Dethiobacteria bacterium]